MPDKNDFSEIISELLRSQDRTNERLERIDKSMENMNTSMENMNISMENMRRENKENTDRMINALTGLPQR